MFPPLPPPNVNVPLPDPAALAQPSTEPDPIQGALSIMAPLFALGTAFGGGPQAGAALLHGTHGAMQEREKQRQIQANQDAQLQIRQQTLAETIQSHQAAEEAKRAMGVQKLITDTGEQLKGAKSRDEYEQIINASEQLGGYFFGLPPNKLRGILPYRAPNAAAIMTAAGEKFLKNPVNQQAIAEGKLDGVVMVDVQGDGIPVPVPVRDVLKAAGTMFDPQSGAPIVGAKPKPGGVQMDDEAFLGEIAKFEAEKQRPATPQERGVIAQRVIKAIGEARRAPTNGPDPILEQIRALTLANLQKGSGSLSPGQATAGGKLADDFRMDSKDFVQVAQAYNRIKASASEPSAAGDLSLIFNYMKVLDPGSTVREGEFANAQNAGSVPSRIWAQYNKIMTGERLAPEMRADFLDRSKRLYDTARQQHRSIEDQYRAKARTVGAPEDFVVTNYAVDEPPTQKDPVKPGGFSVTAPNGKTYRFASQAQLDAFKRAAGIQ